MLFEKLRKHGRYIWVAAKPQPLSQHKLNIQEYMMMAKNVSNRNTIPCWVEAMSPHTRSHAQPPGSGTGFSIYRIERWTPLITMKSNFENLTRSLVWHERKNTRHLPWHLLQWIQFLLARWPCKPS